MPYAQDRAARLYYDDTCGSCGLFARGVAGLSHHRVDLAPLAGPAGDAALGDLPTDARFAAAYLVDSAGRRTGAEIVAPLVGLTLGPTAGRLVARFPVLADPLRWTYRRLWAHRQRRGCTSSSG